MFSIPGFDPKTFSDDELFQKQLDLTKRSLAAARMGRADMANQVQIMIQAIEIERRERMFNERIGAWMLSSPPISIETDPDLKANDEAEYEKTIERSNKPAAPIRQHRIIRSTRPTKPIIPDGTSQ